MLLKKKKTSREQRSEVSRLRYLFTLITNRAPKMSRKTLLISIMIPVLATVVVSTYLIRNHKPSTQGTGVIKTQGLVRGTPSYSTLLPTNKTIDQLGGWSRVSPQGSDPVYAFADTIDTTGITVSQQPIPHDFIDDTQQQVEELAKNFGASEKVTIGEISVYIGTYKDSLQRAIFIKDQLLILIKSDTQLATDRWITYINSLQ